MRFDGLKNECNGGIVVMKGNAVELWRGVDCETAKVLCRAAMSKARR